MNYSFPLRNPSKVRRICVRGTVIYVTFVQQLLTQLAASRSEGPCFEIIHIR